MPELVSSQTKFEQAPGFWIEGTPKIYGLTQEPNMGEWGIWYKKLYCSKYYTGTKLLSKWRARHSSGQVRENEQWQITKENIILCGPIRLHSRGKKCIDKIKEDLGTLHDLGWRAADRETCRKIMLAFMVCRRLYWNLILVSKRKVSEAHQSCNI